MTTVASPAATSNVSVRSVLDVGHHTNKAQRENNEDFLRVQEMDSGLILLLADGMGGGVEGEKFSQEAVLSALRNLPMSMTSRPRDLIEYMFGAAVKAVQAMKQSDSRYAKSGSTLVGALATLNDKQIDLSIGNIGDSRAYLVDNEGHTTCLTQDHIYAERLKREQGLSDKEAYAHHQANQLTAVLGNTVDLTKNPELFFTTRILQPGETLMLCSDGIYKRLSERDIGQVLSKKDSAQHAADALIQLALERQAQDNVSAIVLRHKKPASMHISPLLAAAVIVVAVLVLASFGWGIFVSAPHDALADPNVQPAMIDESTVTPLPPTATVTTAVPTDTPVPGAPTATGAPTFTPTNTPTNTSTNTPTNTSTPWPTPIPTTAVPYRSPLPQAEPTTPPQHVEPTTPPQQQIDPTLPPSVNESW